MNIYRSIKSTCLRTMRVPIIVIALCLILLFALPFLSVFHPTKAHDIYHISSDTKYVKVTAPKLYYSGYDLIGAVGKKYGYYYALENKQCLFVLIPISDTPQETLKNYQFTAKVTSYNHSFDKMVESFAKDLNWDTDSLLQSTKSYVLSNASYHPTFYIILFWIILMILFIHFKKLIQAIIGFSNPNLYPVCSFLGKDIAMELLEEAQEELDDGMYIQINDIYITENYFVDFGKKKTSVIPLADIVWCYRLGNVLSNIKNLLLNPNKHEHKYSIHFTIRNGSVVTIPNKTSDEALELLNAIRATEYDIIIGHSESKKRLAKKRCEK